MKTDFATETEKALFKIIEENVDIEDVETISSTTNMIEDLGVDSLDFLDIAFEIDRAFGIKLPIDDIVSGKVLGVEDAATEMTQEDFVNLITIERVAAFIDKVSGSRSE